MPLEAGSTNNRHSLPSRPVNVLSMTTSRIRVLPVIEALAGHIVTYRLAGQMSAAGQLRSKQGGNARRPSSLNEGRFYLSS